MWAEGRMRSGEPEAVAWLARSLVLCPHLLRRPVDTFVTARQCSSVPEATGVALYTEILCLNSLFFLIPSYHRILLPCKAPGGLCSVNHMHILH
jgi:hypothetical protein